MGINVYYDETIKKWVARSFISNDYVSFGLTSQEAVSNYLKEYRYN